MSKTCARLLGAAAFFLPLSLAAHAEECRLEMVASVEMTPSDDGLLIPVSINGTQKMMMVNTGSPLSSMDPQAATDLKLISHDIVQGGIYTASGRLYTRMARIAEVQIGQLHATDARVLVEPDRLSDDSRIAGLLGADFLRRYDVDIDFGANRFNLFSKDHCAGKVVYWPTDAVAVVPMNVETNGYLTLPVKLDGHEFQAALSTGGPGTLLSLQAAKDYFGLAPNSADMPQIGTSKDGTPFFKHVFKTLEVEGITVRNPTVLIQEDRGKYAIQQGTKTGTMLSSSGVPEGVVDLTLGTNEFRGLHVFISYKEEKLYISASSSPAPAAAATATPPATTPAPASTSVVR